MDINTIGVATVAAIIVICYLIGMVVKATALDSKWIPIICGVCGGIIGALALAFHMPDFPANDYFTAVAVGIMSGLTATGVNQIFKQMKSTNDEISIHAPREGGDSKDAQFYLRIFDKQVELLHFLGKIRGGCLRNPEKDRRFLGKSLANLPAISGHLDFAGAGRRVPDTRAPYHCRAGRRASEDQGILRQIGALRTEMLHFFLILLP